MADYFFRKTLNEAAGVTSGRPYVKQLFDNNEFAQAYYSEWTLDGSTQPCAPETQTGPVVVQDELGNDRLDTCAYKIAEAFGAALRAAAPSALPFPIAIYMGPASLVFATVGESRPLNTVVDVTTTLPAPELPTPPSSPPTEGTSGPVAPEGTNGANPEAEGEKDPWDASVQDQQQQAWEGRMQQLVFTTLAGDAGVSLAGESWWRKVGGAIIDAGVGWLENQNEAPQICGFAKSGNPCGMLEKAIEENWPAIGIEPDSGHWAYRNEGGSWRIPQCLGGLNLLNIAQPDRPATTQSGILGILERSGYAAASAEGSCMAVTPHQPQMPQGGSTMDFEGLGLTPVQPKITQVRRCPGPTRLAKNGMCYHKKLLPAAFRQSKPRRAVISWSEGNAMRKGWSASKRLKELEKRSEKAARKVAPPRRRRS